MPATSSTDNTDTYWVGNAASAAVDKPVIPLGLSSPTCAAVSAGICVADSADIKRVLCDASDRLYELSAATSSSCSAATPAVDNAASCGPFNACACCVVNATIKSVASAARSAVVRLTIKRVPPAA